MVVTNVGYLGCGSHVKKDYRNCKFEHTRYVYLQIKYTIRGIGYTKNHTCYSGYGLLGSHFGSAAILNIGINT